jgi:hypothetical protein
MSTQVVSQNLGESFFDYNMGHVCYPYETKYMFSSIFILKKITINENFENGICFLRVQLPKVFFLN